MGMDNKIIQTTREVVPVIYAYTTPEIYQDRFGKQPTAENIKMIAEIISWNLWQMDGLKDTAPFGIPDDDFTQMTLFDETTNENKPVYCKIQDWHSCEDRIIEYRTVKGSK